jgi:hypothetical protein
LYLQWFSVPRSLQTYRSGTIIVHMATKSKKKTKRNKEWVDPDWDPWYIKMLDAVGEYMDAIGHRLDPEITDRDFIIIRALIEFYGFDADEIEEILDDLNIRAKQLEREKESDNH